ncbi:hypothetical protein GCM10009680_86850 [Streptomyces yatensis]|uniref:Uncharacterized protein n=1 Tax=Streptomyces yatensis TaxID=155177 RepID=A0ABN2JN75_9ACTN
MQGRAGCQQFAQEPTALTGFPAGEHLLELHLCRGLLDSRLSSQRVHDPGCFRVVDGHRGYDHVTVAAVELIAVVTGLVDGDPPACASAVVGGSLVVAATEVRSDKDCSPPLSAGPLRRVQE